MISVKALTQEVSRVSGIPLDKLLSDGRKRHGLLRHEVRFRQVIGFIIKRKRPDCTFVQIGRALGGRDHSTIIHGVQIIRQKLDAKDPDVLNAYRIVYRCYLTLQRQAPAHREKVRQILEEALHVPAPSTPHNPYLDEPFWVTNRARDAQAVS